MRQDTSDKPAGCPVFLFWCREGEGSGRGMRMARDMGAVPVHVWRARLGPLSLPTPLRYLAQAWDTARALRRLRPTALYVQVPPVFALFQAALYGAWHGIPVAADNHSSFLDRRWQLFHWLQRPLSRRIAANIVHNEANCGLLNAWGARGVSLVKSPAVTREELLLPGADLSRFSAELAETGGLRVLMVNRFAVDDAWREVFEAARITPEARFFVTGDPAKANLAGVAVPGNVTLTGLLPKRDFLALMDACDVVLSLTLRRDTLLWSIRECLALAKPFAASDSPVMRAEFDGLGCFTDHKPESLRAALLEAHARCDEWTGPAAAYIARDRERWLRDLEGLSARMARS